MITAQIIKKQTRIKRLTVLHWTRFQRRSDTARFALPVSITEQLHEIHQGGGLCGAESKSGSVYVDAVSQDQAPLLFQCSWLCCCQVWPSVNKRWQAISKTVHPPHWVNKDLDVIVTHLRFSDCTSFHGWTECVFIIVQVSEWTLLPPAMSSSRSWICRWKIFSCRSHRVCFIFSLRVTM